jgi:ABC-type bacteriocin/lantibiotic exporter with double-glycine peptidase domain
MNIVFIILLSFLINFLQINVLSKLTAQIISSLKENKIELVYSNYRFFLCISFIYIIVYTVYKYLQGILGVNLRIYMKQKILSMILKINSNHYSNINFNNYNVAKSRYIDTLRIIFTNILSTLLPNITLLLIIFGFFIYKNVLFGLLFLTGVSFLLIYLGFHFKEIYKKIISFDESTVVDDNHFLTILNNSDKIIFRGTVDNVIEEYNNQSNYSKSKGIDCVNYINNKIFISNIILFITIGCLLFYLIYLAIHKKIDYTLFITFITILLLFRDRISWCIQQLPDYIEAFFRNIDLINDLSHNDYEEIMNNKDKRKNEIQFNAIQFENVSFSYEKNEIFKNYNLTLDINNKIIGITGRSGIGKSTFSKLLLKIYNYSGSIYIDGIDIQNMNTDYLRRNIVYINQNSKLLDDSVYNNLLYGSNNKLQSHNYLNEVFEFKKIKNVLDSIDIEEKAGLHGEKLSGGQRQIINIINGLICDSPMLILDEPTNALDIDLKNDVIHMIKHFKKYKKCIIIITHDKDTYKIFDEKINF